MAVCVIPSMTGTDPDQTGPERPGRHFGAEAVPHERTCVSRRAVGYAGLRPTLAAIKNGKAIGLANKETLVVAGDIVMRSAIENKVPIIPVDSEHSAIFQCLVGETKNKIEKIILTASGGPFLGRKTNYLYNVKREHALQHHNWSKIGRAHV